MVRATGLEPACLSTYEPKSYVSAIPPRPHMNSRRAFPAVIYFIRSFAENQGERKTFAEVTAPKSNESTNSTTPAYRSIFYHALRGKSTETARNGKRAQKICALCLHYSPTALLVSMVKIIFSLLGLPIRVSFSPMRLACWELLTSCHWGRPGPLGSPVRQKLVR